MKHNIILVLIFSFFAPVLSKAQVNNQFIINGVITGLQDGIIVYLTTNSGSPKTDTVGKCQTKAGKFHFSGHVEEGTDWYFLWIAGDKRYSVLLLDNAKVNIKGDVSVWPKLIIVGSRTHADFAYFNERLESLSQELNILKKQNIQTSAVTAKQESLWVNFIKNNHNSLYAPFLAMSRNFSLEQKEAAYTQMNMEVQNSRFGKQLEASIKVLEARAIIKIGSIGPDFVSNTLGGEKLSLLDAAKQSKYTLVDFWASWCGPCRKQTPNIRKVYEAFHDKGFNVLGVSLDFGAKEWREAIIKDSMSWPQVSELKGRDETAGQMFGLNGIPAYLLVDQNGKIIEMDLPGAKVASDLGSLRGDRLYQLIESLLGKKPS